MLLRRHKQSKEQVKPQVVTQPVETPEEPKVEVPKKSRKK